MTNILIDTLPEAVEIDGLAVPINTDFRACLRVILANEDAELTNVEKQVVLLDNLYPELPANVERAFEMGIKFLDGGMSGGEEADENPLRLYSFRQDANLIFAAFRQTHGIDLESIEHLHWWKFLALFMDLGEKTTFVNLISLRKRLKTGKATKEERQMANEMRDMIDLDEPDTRSDEEREMDEAQEAEFIRLWREGQKQREQAKV
jgi:Bacteriophage Gp15 protein